MSLSESSVKIFGLCLFSFSTFALSYFSLYLCIYNTKKRRRKKFHFERQYLKSLGPAGHGTQGNNMLEALITKIKFHRDEIHRSMNLDLERDETIFDCRRGDERLSPAQKVLQQAYVFYHQSIEMIIIHLPESSQSSMANEGLHDSWHGVVTKLSEDYLYEMNPRSIFFESGYDVRQWEALASSRPSLEEKEVEVELGMP